ncbi:hypothetical protein NQ317_010335 [Molorchus minor]|uniref:C2H2-type domain-containing protein n=1 Tax=Molorchus minor TaxID=1323400 RepID=A0ABQ9J3V8_9CUCU|nr:hypothetical protein NQ317_010335 [Molorchus minor]
MSRITTTAELMACRSCATSLASYLIFKTACKTTEENIKYWQDNSNSTERVKLNHVQIFCKENEHEIFGKRSSSENIEVFGVDGPPYAVHPIKTVCLKNNAKEILKSVKVEIEHFEVEMYTCKICQFKTKYKGALNRHLLVHSENSKVKIYSCGTCQYKTKRKETLKKHFLVHRKNQLENFEVEVHTCNTCQYKTKHKVDLKKHVLVHVHRENSEVEMYTCEKCQYKTKRKDDLKRHLLVHRDNCEVEMYTCKMCKFKTKHKGNLKTHLLVHSENS